MANNLTLVQQKLSERLRVSAVSADFDAEKYEARGKKRVYIFENQKGIWRKEPQKKRSTKSTKNSCGEEKAKSADNFVRLFCVVVRRCSRHIACFPQIRPADRFNARAALENTDSKQRSIKLLKSRPKDFKQQLVSNKVWNVKCKRYQLYQKIFSRFSSQNRGKKISVELHLLRRFQWVKSSYDMSVSLGDRNGSAKKKGPRRDGPDIC